MRACIIRACIELKPQYTLLLNFHKRVLYYAGFTINNRYMITYAPLLIYVNRFLFNLLLLLLLFLLVPEFRFPFFSVSLPLLSLGWLLDYIE